MAKGSKKKMKQQQGNRMGWIRNLEALNRSEEDSTWYEFEIASECWIPGEFEYDNKKIFCRFLTLEKDRNGLWHYLLRIQCSKIDFRPNYQANNTGYYFIDGIEGELLALFSLFFQCRFYILACYTLSSEHKKIKTEEHFVYRKCKKIIHPSIFNDKERNFSIGLSEFLNKVRKLKDNKQQGFILACWHYARALKEVSLDSEMVFIRLVSAVEALSKDFPLTKEQNPLDEEDFEELFANANLADQQRDQLREVLRVNEKEKIKIIDKSALKFREFIKNYSEDFSFTHKEEGAADHIYVTPHKLEQTLKSIYNARSKYLHEGEPMHLSKFMNDETLWDFDGSIGGIIDNRRYGCIQKLPYPYWFENLVRHCLLKYLEMNLEKDKN